MSFKNTLMLVSLYKLQLSNEECAKGVIFDKKPPEIEVHIVNADETWPGLLTVSLF